VSSRIYIEGGGRGPDSKELQIRCREAFSALLDKCGFADRKPRLFACGGRSGAFDDFKIAHSRAAQGDYIAMLIDSETPVADGEKPWDHLESSDKWDRPAGADDDRVLLMIACMETWIVTDRPTLRGHYGSDLQESALPALADMESRDRRAVQDSLNHATRKCKNAYAKGKRSFDIVAKLNPDNLRRHLPAFQRFERILEARL
jgi:hypothetical protein